MHFTCTGIIVHSVMVHVEMMAFCSTKVLVVEGTQVADTGRLESFVM